MAKKKNPKISVVIPCYNAENYIEKCLDSILNQTFKDYEVICINDESKDSTLEILKKYEKEYNNVRVYSKKNEGGRNTTKVGVGYANGDYICAIDNDDYVSEYYLEKLYDAVENSNADVAICGFQREDYTTGKVFSKEMNRINGTYVLSDDYGIILEVNTSLWNKLFKKEIFKSILEFDLSATAMGDMTLLSLMYSKIKKISFISDILYFYQVREGSNISNISTISLESVYDTLTRIKKEFYEGQNEDINELIDAYAFLHLGVSIVYRIYKSTGDYRKLTKRNMEVLDTTFSKWKNNKYFSLKYVLTHKGRNLKLFICKLFYRIHMFKFFIGTYDFVTTKLKFDIKW